MPSDYTPPALPPRRTLGRRNVVAVHTVTVPIAGSQDNDDASRETMVFCDDGTIWQVCFHRAEDRLIRNDIKAQDIASDVFATWLCVGAVPDFSVAIHGAGQHLQLGERQ